MPTHKNLPLISFVDKVTFEQWLRKNHAQITGIWVRFYKKNSNVESVSYPEAVDVALCWGWIDGLINKYNEISYLIRFTPRGKKSIWSQINVTKVERLTIEGRMQPSGLAHVEAAKIDGRWANAYPGQGNMKIPPDFLHQIEKPQYTEAKQVFAMLKRSELYSIAFALYPLEGDKRVKKIGQIIQKLLSKHP